MENGQTYWDEYSGFALDYPARYALVSTAEEGFHIAYEGEIVLRGTVERVLAFLDREDYDGSASAMEAFVIGRTAMRCAEASADFRVLCERSGPVEQVTNEQGLRSVRFYLDRTAVREEDETHTSRVGPFYGIEVGDEEEPIMVILIHDFEREAPEIVQQVASQIASTVRRAR